MIKVLKPVNPSREDYFNLSKEFNRKGLLYRRYRQLLWYQENY